MKGRHESVQLSSVIIRSDNTSTCDNLNRRAVGMSPASLIMSLLKACGEVRHGVDGEIHSRDKHISNKSSVTSYVQRVLEQLLQQLVMTIDADLFTQD